MDVLRPIRHGIGDSCEHAVAWTKEASYSEKKESEKRTQEVATAETLMKVTETSHGMVVRPKGLGEGFQS